MTTTTEGGSLTLALRTAQSGVLGNQAAINVVANNVANVNTPNYSRKVVNFEQRVLAGFPAGIQLSAVTRKIDEGLLTSLRLQYTEFNVLDVQRDYFARTQDMFGAPADDFSVAHIMSNFVSALESLADSPDKNLEQSELVRWGREISLKLQEMSVVVQDLRRQADVDIATQVGRMNELTAAISDLNDKIVRNSAVGVDVSDLADQRDASLDELSQIVDIRYFVRGDGDIVVFTSSGRTLVENVPATVTHSPASSVTPGSTYAEGDFGGIFVNGKTAGNDITEAIRGGKLRGLLDLRDGTLPDMQAQLDELAAEMRDTFNQVHNRGLAFPGGRSFEGTRPFVQSGVSTITFGGTTDTRIVLFNNAGVEQASTTVRALLGSNVGTVDQVTSAIQTFLQANGAAAAVAAVGADGKVGIELNTNSLNLAFRDEASVNTRGAAAQDAVIQYDADADGNADETINGFSFFFGLNDFFVDGLPDNAHESAVVSANLSASAATLTFVDSSGVITNSFAVGAGESLEVIAANINNTVANVTASIVPDGSGIRLRISSDDGRDLIVTQAAGDTFLTDIGFQVADVGVSTAILVRADIQATPAKVSRGAVQFDTGIGLGGEYLASTGDDSTAQQLAVAFTSVHAFDQAGGLPDRSGRFTEFAGAILSRNASLADNNDDKFQFSQGLTNSLQLKSDNVRGVNLDEELASLIVFEKAYSAAGRVISVLQDMFDALDQVIR